MRFGFLFLAEFTNMFIFSALGTMLFFGGWQVPWVADAGQWVAPFVFMVKIYIGIFVMMWARGTLPRFRVDQMLAFGWKVLIPYRSCGSCSSAIVVRVVAMTDVGHRHPQGHSRITMRNFFRPPITVQYPEREARAARARALGGRGTSYDADGKPKCTACLICVKECPDCVLYDRDVATARRGGKHIDRYVYEVGACMMCGLCVEACPFDAIEMSHEYELATPRRRQLVRVLLRDVDAASPRRGAARGSPLPRPVPPPGPRPTPVREGGGGCLSRCPPSRSSCSRSPVSAARSWSCCRATSCTRRSGCSRS